ncbi:hypothetical protein [Frigoribacterium sp. PhB160]|uniref:hypothetical protein n=1 Tax=Frigoribacterium sp. PhB160 TaxID=2485192 RepID=UPI0011CE0935|nr:hypothetical protein [Frigoribacterium sp. PhB160]
MDVTGPFILAAGSLAVAIVTVTTTAWDRRRQARSADQQRRLEMVREVIRSLEAVARRQARPIYGRLWANHALEFALAAANLRLLTTKSEEVLVIWLNGEVGRMRAARSDRAATRIGVEAANELASWLSGARTLTWFAQEVAARKPQRKSWLRPFVNSAELVLVTLVMSATAGSVLGGAAWLEGKLSASRPRRRSR